MNDLNEKTVINRDRLLSNIGFITHASIASIQTSACVWVLAKGQSPEIGSAFAGSSVLFILMTFRYIASDLLNEINRPIRGNPLATTQTAAPTKNL